MFYNGNLNDGISLAIQESKVVLCFIRADEVSRFDFHMPAANSLDEVANLSQKTKDVVAASLLTRRRVAKRHPILPCNVSNQKSTLKSTSIRRHSSDFACKEESRRETTD